MSSRAVTVTRSGLGARIPLEQSLRQLKGSEVFVGIPAETAQREGDSINNSSLLYVLSKGSPLRNLPPRPVLEPAIELNKEIIAKELAAAAQAMLERNPAKVTSHLKRAGILAANSAKRYIMQGNNLAPNAPSTIKRKKSSRPLVDTGALVKAIRSVVHQGGVATAEEQIGASEGMGEDAATIGGAAEVL